MLVLGDLWGFAEGDRKEQSANDHGENQNVSNGFHIQTTDKLLVILTVANIERQ